MAKNTILNSEIALIKRMLLRGWSNNTIQFYFNTPTRPFNSGRISEIKSGDRGADIEPSTDRELDLFIESHPITTMSLRDALDDTNANLPQQIKGASEFGVADDQRIDLYDGSLSNEVSDNEEISDVVDELSRSIESLLEFGDNMLGPLSQQLRRLLAELKLDPESSSPVKIWMYGNSLRSVLRAHDLVDEAEDFHPARIDAGSAEILRSVVNLFDLFVEMVPNVKAIEMQIELPIETAEVEENISGLQAAIAEAGDIITEYAQANLFEQIEIIGEQSTDKEKERQLILAGRSSLNFISTLVLKVFRDVRKLVGTEIWEFLKAYKTGAYAAVGLTSTIPLLQAGHAFLTANYPSITAIITSFSQNPTVQILIDFITKAFG